MLKTFAEESVQFLKEGAPICTEEQYEERMSLCIECEHYKQNSSCNLCGCHMPVKAKWQTSKCPDDPPKWNKLTMNADEKSLRAKLEDKEYKAEIEIYKKHQASLRSVEERAKE
jgi:hypothetical protein